MTWIFHTHFNTLSLKREKKKNPAVHQGKELKSYLVFWMHSSHMDETVHNVNIEFIYFSPGLWSVLFTAGKTLRSLVVLQNTLD